MSACEKCGDDIDDINDDGSGLCEFHNEEESNKVVNKSFKGTVITIEDTETGQKVRLQFIPQDKLSEKGNQLHAVQPIWDTELKDIIEDSSDIFKTTLSTLMTSFNIFKNRRGAKTSATVVDED